MTHSPVPQALYRTLGFFATIAVLASTMGKAWPSSAASPRRVARGA